MKRFRFILAFICSLSVHAYSQPPEPPVGKRWILNDKFSDEFNGTKLDLSKWYNYHPTWKGREPGLFMPSQVKVKDGYMTIRGEKMDKDTVIINWDGSKSTYNIKAGAVVSKSLDAFFGYYECKFKAAKTTMSTTFWLSSRAGNYAGPADCYDRYSLEWDIQECIGREGNFDGTWFAKGMHSNSHFWYTDCEGEKHDYRAQSVDFESDKLASDTFNIYGGWWKNERGASYYYNNSEVKSHTFYTAVKEKPFDQPMGVNLVSETYPFPWISLPTDEELADSSKNICYYDWVRAYTMVDVDTPLERGNSLLQNGGFETGDFSYWAGWGGNPREVVSDQAYSGSYAAHIVGPGAPEYVVNLRAFSTYELSCFGKIAEASGPIFFGIKDPSENVLGSIQVTETSYTRKSFLFTTESSGAQLKLYFYAPNAGDEGFADQFELVPVNPDEDPPQETVMFDEELTVLDTIREKTTRQSLDFLLNYMANADREINFRLLNRNKVLVGEQKYLALAGYGTKLFALPLDSIPAAGYDYQLIADIRPIDSSLADTFLTTTFTFDLLDPVKLDIQVLDLRDDSPLESALLIIGDSVKSTDEFGNAGFYNVPVGPLSIQAEREGFLDYHSGETLRQDTSIAIRMTPVSHALTLYILNSHTGEPLTDANIGIDGTSIQSDHNGRASLMIYAGLYPVQIRLERYADKHLYIDIQKDSILYVEMDQILADVKFVLKMDNSSLAGASVHIDDRSELTSTIGMTNFYGLKTDTTYLYRIENQSELLMEDSVLFLTDTTLRINFTTSSSGTLSGPEGLRLYPNPASDHIRLSGLEANCEYEIRDLQGRTVHSGILEREGMLDVSELAPGVYFLKPGSYPVMRFSIHN